MIDYFEKWESSVVGAYVSDQKTFSSTAAPTGRAFNTALTSPEKALGCG